MCVKMTLLSTITIHKEIHVHTIKRKKTFLITLLSPLLLTTSNLYAEDESKLPEWAKPATATHTQVSPPTSFHRAPRTTNVGIGIFEGKSDVGASKIVGTSSYNAKTQEYSITSAGYNIWYVRDEFHYLWKKVNGDISLAANIRFPKTEGYDDRKAVLVIRQSLDDDAKQAVVALHGVGMTHLAWRPEKGERVKDMEYRIGSRGAIAGGESPDTLVTNYPERIGIEKNGNAITLFMSLDGEPMSQFGAPIQLKFKEPFYVGIGFCSHLPEEADTAILSHVVFENSAGKVR